MKTKLWVRQEFDAAHSLEGTFPPNHQCSRMHGHRYTVTLTIASKSDDDVIVDYHELYEGLKAELKFFDHRNLNIVFEKLNGGKPTTCENLARFIFRGCSRRWPQTHSVEVSEQANTGCVVKH